MDVSSVVGAPWRCGVLSTQGGIAGIGLGHLLGREHDSTPQSGVGVPRGACASSWMKTERHQIGLLLLLLLLFRTRDNGGQCARPQLPTIYLCSMWQNTWESDSRRPRHPRALDNQQLLAIEG